MSAVQESAEHAVRTSYGRLLALLASADGDIVAAEDALADALERALTTWPRDGVPTDPDAWLLTAARNKRRDVWKSAAHRTSVALDPVVHAESRLDDIDVDALPDKRLQLMAVCAHPDVDRAVRTPLMLDVVLGFTAKDIAQAFALPASTMAARLGRAKKRIRDAHIPFELPDRSAMPARIDAIREAVYGAFAIDWNASGSEVRDNMIGEAMHLAETLCAVLPEDAEAHGLAALIGLSAARMPARCRGGVLVPLAEQDFQLWDADLLHRGEQHLAAAHRLVAAGSSALGRFQLEAAASAVHCGRRKTGRTDWTALRELYSALQTSAPTVGSAVALAVVTAETDGALAALHLLDRTNGTERFQPAWATRAHLQAQLGDIDSARSAYEKAISLTADPPTRAYLNKQLHRL
ncbi:RNA polymerase sigma factor [Rhodococcoides fascians]|uniref:RNA polymerase sigma factor n=1 Tax=Rhodococcoides fascians TaxID=1828 RepID=UPI00056AC5B1|nr:DUF6596 domain-containing protein [Rhodococcus fascians]